MHDDIPRAAIDEFTRQLNGISDAMRESLGTQLEKIDLENPEAFETVLCLMETYTSAGSDASALIASQFYDAVREYQLSEGVQTYKARQLSAHKSEATEQATRAIFYGSKTVDGIVSKLLDREDYEIKKSAADCIAKNADADPAKPRYARVPTGAETCTFCLMLASRGWVYKSEELASHAHANCDCRIVPGFQGKTKIAGYDPDELYAKWQAFEEIDADSTLTKEEKKARKQALLGDSSNKAISALNEASTKLQSCGLSKSHADSIAETIDKCEDDELRRVYFDSLDDLKFDTLTSSKGAFYSSGTHGITLNIQDTALGFAKRPDKAPYQTFFHEMGHYIDHRAIGYASGRFVSSVNGLGSIAITEVSELIKSIQKENGYSSLREARNHLTREVIRIYKDTPNVLGGLSDIIQGATDSHCCYGGCPGHKKVYFDRMRGGVDNLSTETFAHFCETTMANPDALETLKRYLPKTYDAFRQIVKGI